MGQLDWTPEVYLERIRTQIPRYDELQEQAIAAIPFPPERVLELGMGTGESMNETPDGSRCSAIVWAASNALESTVTTGNSSAMSSACISGPSG